MPVCDALPMSTASWPRPAPAPLLLSGLVLTGVLMASSACSDSGDEASPADALASAKQQLDETTGVALDLTSGGLPDGVDGLTAASGMATHAPAFEGEIELEVAGLGMKVPVVGVDGLVFAKLPFTSSFAEIDPAEYGAPDPAALLNPDTGISSWLVEAEGVTRGEQVREGEVVLTSFAGTLAGEVVDRSIPSAVENAEFEVTFALDEDDLLHKVEVAGPFYEEGSTVEYAVEFSEYGSNPQITRP